MKDSAMAAGIAGIYQEFMLPSANARAEMAISRA
jgi:hypothetical protein